MTAWTPTAFDLAWCQRNVLDVLADGGMWGTAIGVYRLDKQAKTLTLLARSPYFNADDHQRNVIAFAQLGYTVLERMPCPES